MSNNTVLSLSEVEEPRIVLVWSIIWLEGQWTWYVSSVILLIYFPLLYHVSKHSKMGFVHYSNILGYRVVWLADWPVDRNTEQRNRRRIRDQIPVERLRWKNMFAGIGIVLIVVLLCLTLYYSTFAVFFEWVRSLFLAFMMNLRVLYVKGI